MGIHPLLLQTQGQDALSHLRDGGKAKCRPDSKEEQQLLGSRFPSLGTKISARIFFFSTEKNLDCPTRRIRWIR